MHKRKEKSDNKKFNPSGKGKLSLTEITKYKLYKTLKVAFYLLGFPLALFLTMKSSNVFYSQTGFQVVENKPALAMIVVWLVVVAISLIVKVAVKGFTPRAIIVITSALVLMIGVGFLAEMNAKRSLKATEKKYSFKNTGMHTDMPRFQELASWFVPYTPGAGSRVRDYTNTLNDFKRIYGIDVNSSTIKAGQNGDGKAPLTYDKKNDATYNKNGLYADGYIFGLKQVYKTIATVEDVEKFYSENGRNLEIEIIKETNKLIADKNSAWNKYISSPEYQEAIYEGKRSDGAAKYEIDAKKLDDIVKAVAASVNAALTGSTEGLNLVQTIMDLAKVGDIKGLLGVINTVAKKNFTVDDILGFLKPFSTYHLSNVKPIFMFLPDKKLDAKKCNYSLKDYALASYNGNIHGAIVGAVIIPNKDGRIGRITLDTPGTLAAGNAMDKSALFNLMVQMDYAPSVFTDLMVRRMMFSFVALVAVFLFASYYFGFRENQMFNRITDYKFITEKQKKKREKKGKNNEIIVSETSSDNDEIQEAVVTDITETYSEEIVHPSEEVNVEDADNQDEISDIQVNDVDKSDLS